MPRKYRGGRYRGSQIYSASMRPGRMPRKYQSLRRQSPPWPPGFNEAGADAPEIPISPMCSCATSISLQ